MKRFIFLLLVVGVVCVSKTSLAVPAQTGGESLHIEITSEIPQENWEIIKQGNFLYVLDQLVSAFQVYDLSNTAYPHLLATLHGIGGFYLEVAGDFAYITAGSDNIKIIDISDPANPQFLTIYTGFEWHKGLPPQATFMAGTGDKLFVKVSYRHVPYGCAVGEYIAVLDVSDPANPIRIGTLGSYNNYPLAKDRQFIYDSIYSNLRIYDTRSPGIPPLVGTVDIPGFEGTPFVDIVARNGYVLLRFTDFIEGCYYADVDSWHVMDVSKPSDPQVELSQSDGEHFPRHVADGYVYLQGPNGFEMRSYPDFAAHSQFEGFGVGYLEDQEGFFQANQIQNPGGETIITFRISAVSETVDPATPTTLAYTDTLGLTSFEIMTGTVVSPTVVSILPLPKADDPPLHSIQIQAFDIRGHRPNQQLTLDSFQQPITATLPVTLPPPDPDFTWEFLYWTGTHWVDAATTCAGFPEMAENRREIPGNLASTQFQFCLPGKYGLFELPVLDHHVYLPAVFYQP